MTGVVIVFLTTPRFLGLFNTTERSVVLLGEIDTVDLPCFSRDTDVWSELIFWGGDKEDAF